MSFYMQDFLHRIGDHEYTEPGLSNTHIYGKQLKFLMQQK